MCVLFLLIVWFLESGHGGMCFSVVGPSPLLGLMGGRSVLRCWPLAASFSALAVAVPALDRRRILSLYSASVSMSVFCLSSVSLSIVLSCLWK